MYPHSTIMNGVRTQLFFVTARRLSSTALLLTLLAVCVPSLVQASTNLTLRVNDMEAVPGGLAAIVIRTYVSRPIVQGQLCLRAAVRRSAAVQASETQTSNRPHSATALRSKSRLSPTSSPFVSIFDWTVYSSNGDATGAISLQNGNQIDLDFSSLTSSINDSDGPMIVIYAVLDPSLSPGTNLDISLDGLGTSVFEDVGGSPTNIPTTLRSGNLRVVAPTNPLTLGAEAESTVAGSVAHLAVVTRQVEPWTSGYLEVSYPTSVADGLPTVTVDPRYGTASLVVLHPAPGLVAIDFQSADQSLNQLPGEVLQISLPTKAKAATGAYPLSLNSVTAEVRDASGLPLVLDVATGNTLQIMELSLFADGFESGDVTEWAP